jgi:hypothetical protein
VQIPVNLSSQSQIKTLETAIDIAHGRRKLNAREREVFDAYCMFIIRRVRIADANERERRMLEGRG